MKKNVSDFTKGWFIGNFEPSLLKSKDFEVAIKEYKAGTVEGQSPAFITPMLSVVALPFILGSTSAY